MHQTLVHCTLKIVVATQAVNMYIVILFLLRHPYYKAVSRFSCLPAMCFFVMYRTVSIFCILPVMFFVLMELITKQIYEISIQGETNTLKLTVGGACMCYTAPCACVLCIQHHVCFFRLYLSLSEIQWKQHCYLAIWHITVHHCVHNLVSLNKANLLRTHRCPN